AAAAAPDAAHVAALFARGDEGDGRAGARDIETRDARPRRSGDIGDVVDVAAAEHFHLVRLAHVGPRNRIALKIAQRIVVAFEQARELFGVVLLAFGIDDEMRGFSLPPFGARAGTDRHRRQCRSDADRAYPALQFHSPAPRTDVLKPRASNYGPRFQCPDRSSDEAVGIYVDREACLGGPVDASDPVADRALQVEAARGVQQQAEAVPPAQHREWRGGGAIDGEA